MGLCTKIHVVGERAGAQGQGGTHVKVIQMKSVCCAASEYDQFHRSYVIMWLCIQHTSNSGGSLWRGSTG